jgi:signal transduction histidine kinase
VRGLKLVDGFFLRQSRNAVLLLCLGVAILLGILDVATKADLLVLYLAPIFAAAWYGGRRPGMVVAFYCAASTFITQRLNQGVLANLGWDDIWSLAVRLATYLIVAHVISKLQESRRQQEELAQFIVHDLRSPIASSITGLMTLDQMSHNLDPVQREMVSLALVSNQRALNLVNSMLDVAKLETGKMELAVERVSIPSFLDESLQPLVLWAQSHDVGLETASEVESAVLDSDLTSRVLVNLASNALKYSPSGATVRVTVERVPHALKFGVHDRGPGIPPEYAESIFEPFGQVKGTKGGTGLGLTFCRLAIQAQGGRIWVESTVGEGTSMYFTLPEHPSTAETKSGSTEPSKVN